MDTITLSLDLTAVARAAEDAYDNALGRGLDDAQLNNFDRAATAKYSLKRVRAAGLITEEEEEQLVALIEGVAQGEDRSDLRTRLEESPDASPVALALAQLGTSGFGDHIAAVSGAVIGAIAGESFSREATDPKEALVLAALLSIVAAAGAAAAAGIESRRPRTEQSEKTGD